MRVAKVLSYMLVIHLAAYAAGNTTVSAAGAGTSGADACEPGAVMEILEDDMKTGLSGSNAEKISKLYDVFFQTMRACDNARDLDFLVKQEWGNPRMARALGFPDLNPYEYFLRNSAKKGLCLSRIGAESMLLSYPKWYCERAGWSDEI